jgi:lipopolysaccharide export system protein LptA
VGVSHFNQHHFKLLGYCATVFYLVLCAVIHFAQAQDMPLNHKKATAEKNSVIHITSDKLISYNKAGYAEFIGNVTATQKGTVITSDRLKVIFKKNIAGKGPLSVNEESIREIVAKGNVKIKFDNRVAVTQQAVYNTNTMVLVLTGEGSRITSGKDSISGEKITFYRADGRVNVESGSKKRVEAVFFSGQQDKK